MEVVGTVAEVAAVPGIVVVGVVEAGLEIVEAGLEIVAVVEADLETVEEEVVAETVVVVEIVVAEVVETVVVVEIVVHLVVADDKNGDGFIDYKEFVLAQQAAASQKDV